MAEMESFEVDLAATPGPLGGVPAVPVRPAGVFAEEEEKDDGAYS